MRIRKKYRKGEIVYCYVNNERGTIIGLNKRYSEKNRPAYNVQLDSGEQPAVVFDNIRAQPVLDEDIDGMSIDRLQSEVIRLRNGIRKYRDQTGHDLCWFNPELTGLLPEQLGIKAYVPPFCEFMQNCAAFRQSLENKTSTEKSKWEILQIENNDLGYTVSLFTRQVHGKWEYAIIKENSCGQIIKEYLRDGHISHEEETK